MKTSKTVATEAAKQTGHPIISKSRASTSQGVLVLSEGVKPVLGKVKIAKNVKVETSKVIDKSRKWSVGGVDDIGQKIYSPLPLVKGGYPLCITMQSVKKSPYVTTVTPAAKGQRTRVTKTSSMLATGTTKPQEKKDAGKLQTFENAFGGSALQSHLASKNVPDDYELNLDKDKQSLATLKTLMSSHFVHRYDKDYDNLRLELKRVKLQRYFPVGIVVKEGYDIYDMICEIMPENTVADLRSRLCKYLTVNIDYFGSLFSRRVWAQRNEYV